MKLTFEDFKRMAQDKTLDQYETIGFTAADRKDREGVIFADILGKLTNLDGQSMTVIDIGCGVGGLSYRLDMHCEERHHKLILNDSAEMLDQNWAVCTKFPGRFPDECGALLAAYAGKADAVLVYSVLQYVHHEGNYIDFIVKAMSLLAPGGQLLIGDIPNADMRNRAFSKDIPDDGLRDSDVFAILRLARERGFHAFVMPQGEGLPLANRREDILIVRPGGAL